MIVKPALGALVRDPATRRAVEPGAIVNETEPYWSRLIRDGDMLHAPELAPAGDDVAPSQNEDSEQ
jgi:hypothetical protein